MKRELAYCENLVTTNNQRLQFHHLRYNRVRFAYFKNIFFSLYALLNKYQVKEKFP